MADEEVEEQSSPYEPPAKFATSDQESVHTGLVSLIRSKLGPDMADLTEAEVLEAAHTAYGEDMPAQEFLDGAKIVMSEKMRGALQGEADRRATAGEGAKHKLSLKNLRVGAQPIKGVEVSGVPGVEERKALGKKVGEFGKALGKGFVQSFSTPLPGLMQWVAAHGLTQEEIAPEVYQVRFAGAGEQDKLEKEAVRRIARETLDTVGWGIAGGEMVRAIRIPGFSNTFARLGAEGAGWGATYEGIDATLAGESAEKVAKRTAVGGLLGAGLTVGIGGAFVGLGRLVKGAIGEKAVQAMKSERPVSDFPGDALTPGERIAVEYQKTSTLPETVQPFVVMAQRGDIPPEQAAIHILGNMGVVNDAAGTAALAAQLEPKSLVASPMKDVALTIPEATRMRLEKAQEDARFLSRLRQMAIESGQAVADIRERARTEKWASPEARANLAQQVPEPILLESDQGPIQLGPGTGYKPERTQALRIAQEMFPHIKVTQTPRSMTGRMVASTYKAGETVYDEVGRAHEVLGYTENDKIVTRTQMPGGDWKYGVAGASDVSPYMDGFIAAINRLEAGAKARLESMARGTTLASFPTPGLEAWAQVGVGKFARATYMAAKMGLDREQTYILWAKDMADEMRAHGDEKRIVLLRGLFDDVEAEYGETVSKIVLRDSSMREGLYEAVERMKKGGWVGHDWYDETFPRLVEMFGAPEDAARFADFLAITSANRNIDSNVNLALQAFAMAQTGQLPKGFGPNMDAMFAKYFAEEGRTGLQPEVRSFASAAGAPKVSEFVRNVRGADVNSVTLDVWMNRYLVGGETMRVKEKEAAKAIIRDIAAREGLTPRQVQAAMWADARIAEQVLGPLGKGEKLEMTMGSMRPYQDVTGNFLKKKGHFGAEASIIKQTRENGGGTFYPGTSRPFDRPGFSVALGGEAIDAEKAMPNGIRKVVESYLPSLRKVASDAGANLQFVVGTWVDEGKMHVEIGVVVPERERALTLGNIAKQQSISELGEGGSFVGVVPTGHEAATTLSLTDAKKALKEWISAPSPNQ